jgi:ATP-binding cassette subfamily F protein 3
VLARLLLAKPDLLILDEPTNHLDLDSLIWLEGYLKGTPSSLLLVSHDRVFLNNVATRIVELRQGRADSYPGNYEQFLEAKAMRIATESAAFQNQRERIKQMERFIEKNRVRASTARRAQSRVKAMDRIDRLSPPDSGIDPSFTLALPVGRRGPDMVAELKNVSKSYGELDVFTDLNLSLRRTDRLALVGPNGRGKSTVIKLIAGAAAPTSGTSRLGQSVDVGYFSQFQMESLDASRTVLEEFASVAAGMSIGQQRSILAGFLFQEDDVFKRVKVLSGGEKTRLVLAKIMMCAPNLLLLDEPTNHLDIAGRQMLEEALADYAGTMIIISHDRHFINRLATSVGVIENGGLTVYPGDYDDFRDIWLPKIEDGAEAGNAASSQPAQQTAGGSNAGAGAGSNAGSGSQGRQAQSGKARDSKKNPDPKEAARRKEDSRRKSALKKSISENGVRLEAISKRLKELEGIFSVPDVYKDRPRMKALLEEQVSLRKEEGSLEKVFELEMTELDDLERAGI